MRASEFSVTLWNLAAQALMRVNLAHLQQRYHYEDRELECTRQSALSD
jgi:hypothetical protein